MPELNPAELRRAPAHPDPGIAAHAKHAARLARELEKLDAEHAQARAKIVAELEHHRTIAGVS